MKSWLALIALFAALLCGCYHEPKAIRTDHTNNPKVDVELIIEHDGCRVYRFWDGGHWVYFVKGGEQTMWGETVSDPDGKHSHVEHRSAQTVRE
jgi:hypothetical protein